MTELRDATTSEGSAQDDARARIVAVATDLLAGGGRDALTTRAVAAAAGVQAPAIYRLFGDKSGLLDAVAQHGFATYLKEKEVREPGSDPVEDLRRGWDLHVGFGLAHPAVYTLMYGDPRPGLKSPAAAAAFEFLRAHIRRLAVAGRLRLSEERAVQLVHACGCGTVLTLLEMPEEHRDWGLSKAAREAVVAAITTENSVLQSPGFASAAIALRAALPEAGMILTEGERHVLEEWLDRLAHGSGSLFCR